jgi:hypothetical protein
MNDESGPSIWSSLSGLRKGISSRRTSADRQTPGRSQPGGLSRKQQIMEEEYAPPQRRADPDPGKSRLCYECKNFMNNIHCHPWSDPKRVQIPLLAWRYQNLQEPSSCVLCQMISDIVVANFCGNSENRSSISHWIFLLRPTQFGEVCDSESGGSFGQNASFTRTRYARWCLGIEVNDLSGNKIRRQVPNVIHGATRPLPKPFYVSREEAPFAQRMFLNGRARALECDTELLKAWLRLCDRYHVFRCAPRSSRLGPGIRLIDTKDQCIISSRLLGSFVPRDYVALSYVWGDVEQSYAPSGEAYSALAKKGALLDLRPSKTISDAMQLVQRLGLRYLWVDALCIKQDDFSDKEEQMAQMGFVYQNALFTIIAASGNDCDAGLPGIRPGTRFRPQQLVQAGDITLISSIQHPCDRILTPETSKWARRAWTFQEELLSPRLLIFTDEQVWWRCPCATWCEDSQLETKDATGFLLTGQTVERSLKERYSKLRPDDYFDLVTNYAQRQLSYPSDALNAFAGILSMLTDYSNEQFLWGLMTSTFERQLYWVGKAKMRTSLQDGYFPTWSWVGWEGDVSFRHYQTYKPVVACFAIHKDKDGHECAQVVCSPPTGLGAGDYDLPLGERSVVSIEIIRKAYPIHSLISNFHLFFYTYSAKFYLIPQGRLILPNLPPRYAYDKEGRLLGPKPDYGYLVPSLDDTELCEKGHRECILLGKRSAASAWDTTHVVVMLITRRYGIAHRLGIADMSEGFWNLADKTWELIALG